MATPEQWRYLLVSPRPPLHVALLRVLLRCLARIYVAGLSLYLALERLGIRKRTKLSVPVISVGNISVGGTGKTPFVVWLAQSLQARAICPAILSRGHGGALSRLGAMISDNHGTVVDDAAQTGDEPLLLAKSLIGVPVYVGKDRRKTGRCAITKFAPSCIILDDGMQYWQLYRNLDIVLVDAAMPFESGECLPAGFLREPPKALRRAGIVVVTRSDAIGQNECVLVANKINALAPNAKIFFARHVIAAFEPLHCADNRSKVSEIKRRAYMFCGIARPESFFDSALPLVSAEVVGRSAFPDHVEYSSDVLEQLEADIRRSRAEVVLTTQKDAMKLKDWNIAWPIYASVMNMMIDNDTDLLTDIVSKALCNEAGVRK